MITKKELKKIPAEAFRKPMNFKQKYLIPLTSGYKGGLSNPDDYYSIFYKCPRCEATLENETISYCDCCGQRLGKRSKAVIRKDKNYYDYIKAIKQYKIDVRTVRKEVEQLKKKTTIYFD